MAYAEIVEHGARDAAQDASILAEDLWFGQTDAQAQALAQSLLDAQGWQAEILALALAQGELGDIALPEPQVPTRNAAVLAALPALYWVHGLDEAGLLQAAETVAGLWASGAIQTALPDHGQALQQYWRQRRERLSAEERQHLLALVFDPRDFHAAMHRVCRALVALADNAGQRDLREEVGLEQAAGDLLELCARRLEGAPLVAAPELMAQARAAVQLLSQRALQTAFAVHDFYALMELGQRQSGGAGRGARALAERAQAGAAILRWLAQAAAQRFAIDPAAASLQGLIAYAQRWLMTSEPPGARPAGIAMALAVSPTADAPRFPAMGHDDPALGRLLELRNEHAGIGGPTP